MPRSRSTKKNRVRRDKGERRKKTEVDDDCTVVKRCSAIVEGVVAGVVAISK